MIIKKGNTLDVIKNVYFRRSEPISVVHFLTNRCNARCAFCFIDFDNPETFKSELSLDEIETLTKSFGKSLLNVNFTMNPLWKNYKIAKCIQIIQIFNYLYYNNGSLPTE